MTVHLLISIPMSGGSRRTWSIGPRLPVLSRKLVLFLVLYVLVVSMIVIAQVRPTPATPASQGTSTVRTSQRQRTLTSLGVQLSASHKARTSRTVRPGVPVAREPLASTIALVFCYRAMPRDPYWFPAADTIPTCFLIQFISFSG